MAARSLPLGGKVMTAKSFSTGLRRSWKRGKEVVRLPCQETDNPSIRHSIESTAAAESVKRKPAERLLTSGQGGGSLAHPSNNSAVPLIFGAATVFENEATPLRNPRR